MSCLNSLEDEAANYSSIPKSERPASVESDKDALRSFSAYQNAHSFYKEIKSEKEELLKSQGKE